MRLFDFLLALRLVLLKMAKFYYPNYRLMMLALPGEDNICSSNRIIFSYVFRGNSSDSMFLVYLRRVIGLVRSTSTDMLRSFAYSSRECIQE